MATHELPAPAPRDDAAPPAAVGAPTAALGRARAATSLLLTLAAAVLLVATNLALLQLFPIAPTVDIGTFRDKAFVDGVHRQEAAPDGLTYRWSREQALIWLDPALRGPHTALLLQIGGRPAPAEVALTLNGQPWAGFAAETTPRRYWMLLPPPTDVGFELLLRSDTFRTESDARELGLKLDALGLRALADAAPLPAPAALAAQLATLALAQLAVLRLGWGRSAQAALGVGLALALPAVLAGELLLAASYLPRLAVAAGLLTLLTWLLLPSLERAAGISRRAARALWALALLAAAVRLVAVLYPTFSGQDMAFHTSHLTDVAAGRLFLVTGSTEFGGKSVYPPGVYLATLPGMLLTEDLRGMLQVVLALLDGATALLVGLLALRLGGGPQAAQIAALLYVGSVAALGALNFGFAAQIFGQWFVAPLALLLLAAVGGDARAAAVRRGSWALVGAVLLLALLSHAGVAFLAAGWLGLLVALLTLRRGGRAWPAWAAVGGAGLAAFVLLYTGAAALIAGTAARQVQGAASGAAGAFPGFSPLLVSGVRLAFGDVGLALLPLGLIALAAAAPERPARLIVALSWLAAATLFLLINVLTTMQVRYLYFALPLVLALAALPLGRLASRGPAGRLSAWALALSLALPGLWLWFTTTMRDGRIPMTPLTH